MTPLRPACFAAAVALLCSSHVQAQSATGAEIVQEMNLARRNPAQYATHLEAMRPSYDGKLVRRPGLPALQTKEGVAGLDDAIRFLKSARPQPTLVYSAGISRAAADHCASQSNGAMGHRGRGWSNPGDRMNRYGMWSEIWGENLAYGRTSAREIVIALIVDDGLRSRKHRKNIFNPAFKVAGAATGAHATYRSVCSIDFAGGYLESGSTQGSALLARNP